MGKVKTRGGCSGADNAVELEKALRKMAAKKQVRLSMPSPAAKQDDGRMDSKDLSDYVNDIATGSYDFVLNVVKPFIAKLNLELREIGDEVNFDQCEDGEQSKQERQKDYESTVLALQMFSPENDGILREQADIVERKAFVEALCLRVRCTTAIALLVDAIRTAESKDELEELLDNATESEDKNSKEVFVLTTIEKTPMRAFGENYKLTAGVFGRYHAFACEKLTEAVNGRARELATAHKAKEDQRKQQVSTKDDTHVSPEELLFGNTNDVNEKTSVLSWKFQGHENLIKLRRSGDHLYVLDAVGMPLKALEDMREEWEKPFVFLTPILTKDGANLCQEKIVDGRSKYDLGVVTKSSFPMVCWIRTAAGACISSRLLPNEMPVANNNQPQKPTGKTRPVKAEGELLTSQEFLYSKGLGQYDLVYAVGFHYEPRDEKGKPNGQTFTITTEATARIERKQVDGKDKIALISISTSELATLLEAGGALAEHEFFEGVRGASLPTPIYLGISQAFARLKISETQS